MASKACSASLPTCGSIPAERRPNREWHRVPGCGHDPVAAPIRSRADYGGDDLARGGHWHGLRRGAARGDHVGHRPYLAVADHDTAGRAEAVSTPNDAAGAGARGARERDG